MSRLAAPIPGVLLAGILGSLAYGLGQRAGAHTDWVSDVVVAILLGVVVLNAPLGRVLGLQETDGGPTRWSAGLQFTDKRLLRLAIVLMGLKVQADLFEGEQLLLVLGILAVGLPVAFLLVRLVSKRLRLGEGMSDLLSIGTMVCGASAIHALSPVVSASKRDRGVAISAVFLFSIVALLVFSPLAGLAGLSPEFGGLWAGLAVNDLSSSVAVGSQFGSDAEVLAAASKSVRILLLGPLLVAFSMRAGQGKRSDRWWEHLPLFIVGYLLFFAIRLWGDASFGSDPLWQDLLTANSSLVKWLILVVCAGIGLQIRIRTLLTVGWKAALAGGAGSIGLAGTSLLVLWSFEHQGAQGAVFAGVGPLLLVLVLYRLANSRD